MDVVVAVEASELGLAEVEVVGLIEVVVVVSAADVDVGNQKIWNSNKKITKHGFVFNNLASVFTKVVRIA